MASQTEANDQNKEEQKHLQEKIIKITMKIEEYAQYVTQIMALIAAGQKLYQNTMASVEKIKTQAESTVDTAKRIGNDVKSSVTTSLTNPMSITNSVQNLQSSANEAFGVLDSSMSFLDYTLSSSDFIPSKLQEKISEKELQAKLKLAQEKLKEYKEVAEKWIKEHTEKYAAIVIERQNEWKRQADRQIQRAVNSVSTFTGIDPQYLNDLIERAEAMGMAYATGKKSAADQLDDLVSFAKAGALSQGLNIATAQGMKLLDKSGLGDIAEKLEKETPKIRKITGFAMDKLGVENELGSNINSEIKNRLKLT